MADRKIAIVPCVSIVERRAGYDTAGGIVFASWQVRTGSYPARQRGDARSLQASEEVLRREAREQAHGRVDRPGLPKSNLPRSSLQQYLNLKHRKPKLTCPNRPCQESKTAKSSGQG